MAHILWEKNYESDEYIGHLNLSMEYSYVTYNMVKEV